MRRPDASQPAADLDAADPAPPSLGAPSVRAAAVASLSDLPVAGLTRRRIALAIGALVCAWVIVLFARQVGQASEATAHAQAMRTANAALEVNVAALQQELDLIQRQAYIAQQAREYRLGSPREIPFALADDAPSLAPDAPGSAGVRLGAVTDRPSPLGSWIRMLFGPGGDPARPAGAGG
jgi:cell division protein FtsB